MNTVKDLIKFFSEGCRPVSTAEFMDFWKSLSDSEKEYYKNAPLS